MAMRIQRKRIKGWRAPTGMIVVSRPSMWSNPYRVGFEAKNNAEAVKFFERDLEAARRNQLTEEMLAVWRKNHKAGAAGPFYIAFQAREQLRGFDLACWCGLDEACHADVLLKMANEEKS
jgi:hypothetical protein